MCQAWKSPAPNVRQTLFQELTSLWSSWKKPDLTDQAGSLPTTETPLFLPREGPALGRASRLAWNRFRHRLSNYASRVGAGTGSFSNAPGKTFQLKNAAFLRFVRQSVAQQRARLSIGGERLDFGDVFCLRVPAHRRGRLADHAAPSPSRTTA